MNISTIVQRIWNYCNVLRDDGISYGDYVEQRLSVAQEASYRDGIESVVAASRLRHAVPAGGSVLKSAFEWRLGS